MPKKPPVSELQFLKISANFRELSQKLTVLGLSAPDIREYANHVCECWFKLAEEHLVDARSALASNSVRSAYSRAYYAAYNASKAARYFTAGFVSLKGDDHAKAATDLPDDLTDVEQWSRTIVSLYEHRLRADYDNWSDTQQMHSISSTDAVRLADEFVQIVRAYMATKHGVTL